MKQELADSDIGHAQAKAQERVKLRHQGSRDASATVKPSEIAPGIVSRRQLTYGSPVRKAEGVNGKPAWR